MIFAFVSSFSPTLKGQLCCKFCPAGKRWGSSNVSNEIKLVNASWRVTSASLDALLFDCDGVLADTERDAHRVAFNIAFSERGIDDVWDERLYGILLATGGGKERMTARWNDIGWPSVCDSTESRAVLVKELHARKTELFMQLVGNGEVPLRPGVQRLVNEAFEAGIPVGVCSTSNEKAVAAIVAQLGKSRASKIRIFAGDVVQKKKPAPDIYQLAAEELDITPSQVCGTYDLPHEPMRTIRTKLN